MDTSSSECSDYECVQQDETPLCVAVGLDDGSPSGSRSLMPVADTEDLDDARITELAAKVRLIARGNEKIISSLERCLFEMVTRM